MLVFDAATGIAIAGIRLLVDRDVLLAQPALLSWQGESLVEVDLVLSRCGTGTSLLFHSAEGRLKLVAALVAAE